MDKNYFKSYAQNLSPNLRPGSSIARIAGISLAAVGVGSISSSAEGVLKNSEITPIYSWQELWDARKNQVLQANPSQVFIAKDDVFTYANMRTDCDGGYENIKNIRINLHKDRRTIEVSIAQTAQSIYHPIANNFANQTADQPSFGFSVQCDDFTIQRRTVEVALKKNEKSRLPTKMSGNTSRIILPQHNIFTASFEDLVAKRKDKVFIDNIKLRTHRKITKDELRRKLVHVVFYSERTERAEMPSVGKIRTMAGIIIYRPLSRTGKTTRKFNKEDVVLSGSRNKRSDIMNSAIK